jgi:protoporphyrinogen/coproporphyrinogen III oxidase
MSMLSYLWSVQINHLQAADWLSKHHSDIIAGEKSSKASRNRFIYYPDHLVRLPSPYSNPLFAAFDLLRAIRTEPLLKGVIGAVFGEPRKTTRVVEDESVGHFLSRKFGPAVADNIASAVFHGIYAGDIYQLSAKTLLPQLKYLDSRHPRVAGVLSEWANLWMQDQKLMDYEALKYRHLRPVSFDKDNMTASLRTSFESSSFVTWPEGMQYLVDTLERILREDRSIGDGKINIELNSKVRAIARDVSSSKVVVSTRSSLGLTSRGYDYVVSTLDPATMKQALQAGSPRSKALQLRSLDEINKSVSVMVVNLYYPDQVLLPEHEGFGYLIPRSVPLKLNPERGLGVVFAHNASGKPGPDNCEMWTKEDMHKELEDNAAILVEANKIWGGPQEAQAGERYQGPSRDTPSPEVRFLYQKHQVGKDNWEQVQGGVIRRKGQDTVAGSKLAVMLGGHWWDGWAKKDLPTEEKGIKLAKDLVARHLGVFQEPEVAKARLQWKCIPQYPVGYQDSMKKLHEEVLEPFKGRLKVAGSWYQGAVGVNDCIHYGTLAAMSVTQGWDEFDGTEKFLEDDRWILFDKDTNQIVRDPKHAVSEDD